MRKGGDFKFESVDRLDYKLHNIKLRRGGSYIKSPEWIRNKRATINPKDEDGGNCFQYALTATLNHQNIRNHPERISNIKPFIDEYNWEGIHFPSHQDGQEESEKPKNMLTIESLNKIKRRLHSIYYMCLTIKERYVLHMNQKIIASAKTK